MSEQLLSSETEGPGRTQSKCVALAVLSAMCFATWGVGLLRAFIGDYESVSGRVTLNNLPLANAQVALHPLNPVSSSFDVPRGETDRHGDFRIRSIGGREGAEVGRYVVTVRCHRDVLDGESLAAGPNILPQRYALPNSTPLVVEIERGVNRLNIELNTSDDARIVVAARTEIP